MFWYQVKLFAMHVSGVSMDALHILVGSVLLILAAIVTRTTLASPRPWLIVLVLELANEANDLIVERWPEPAMQYGEGAKDLLLTMLMPTLLLILVRLCPGLFASSTDGKVPGRSNVGVAGGGSPRQQDKAEAGSE